MAVLTLDDVRSVPLRIFQGDQLAFQDKDGRVRIGTIRFKKIRCGKKGCTKCPHELYAYAQYRVGKKVKEKYIGVAR